MVQGVQVQESYLDIPLHEKVVIYGMKEGQGL